MPLSVLQYLLGTVGVTSCSVIFLCSTSVAVITSQANSKNFLFFIPNDKVNRSSRIRVIFKYRMELNICTRPNRPFYGEIGQSGIEHRKETFRKIISFLPSIFVFPKHGTESLIRQRTAIESSLNSVYAPKIFAIFLTYHRNHRLLLEHFNGCSWRYIFAKYSIKLHSHLTSVISFNKRIEDSELFSSCPNMTSTGL